MAAHIGMKMEEGKEMEVEIMEMRMEKIGKGKEIEEGKEMKMWMEVRW